MGALLFGVAPLDPLTDAAAALILLTATAAACAVAAVRAARRPLSEMLRAE